MKPLSKFFLGVLLLTVFSAATEAPIAAADFDLVVGIEVGESLTINDIDWFALVNSDSFDLSGPFLTEGDGSTCVLGGKYGGDVVGKASGTCIAKYIVEADGSPQSLFFRVDVGGGSDTTEAPATTTVAPTTVDVDLVAEILVGETFVTYLGFKNLGLVDTSSVYALKVNLIEGDASACVLGGGHGDDVVGDDVLGALEPELGDAVENLPLQRNRAQDVVESALAISGNEDPLVIQQIHVPHLALFVEPRPAVKTGIHQAVVQFAPEHTRVDHSLHAKVNRY